MTDTLKIALAQLNPTVGDLDGNAGRLQGARAEAAKHGADLVVATELVVSGYPPEDLVLKPAFQDSVERIMSVLAEKTADGGPGLLVGAPWRGDGELGEKGALYNAALLLDGGRIAAVRLKHDLPNYGVFDEKRVFVPGPLPGPVNFRGIRLGVMVCEDMWAPDVTECLEENAAEILIVINGSPFEVDKQDVRTNLAVARVTESGLPLVYVNQVGGQDELVFDGCSFVLDADRSMRLHAPGWREGVFVTDWHRNRDDVWTCTESERVPPTGRSESIYRAMMLGLHDYVDKNGFPGVLIGLSGGIDSALTAAVATDALGPDRVHCVLMPSPYTSSGSLDDAAEVAQLLGVRLDSIDIQPAMTGFDRMLADVFRNLPKDTTEENIQARIRGITLMALSNKFGHMVLSTGNKSEMSVGYATLYGDMSGGYSVLKDVYKTTVYAVARWRNQRRPEGGLGPDGRVIPEHILTKAPSAELRPDQTDQDTLPPYDELDAILHGLIEEELGMEEIATRGHDIEIVRKVWRMVDIAEYKRRQAPPGVKISRRAFGRDRRYPITNAYKGLV